MTEQSMRELAMAAARLGEEFIAAVRQADSAAIEALLLPASSAFLCFEMFGAGLFRLDLRLDDPREQSTLAPYDLQIEEDTGWLELGVVTVNEEGHRFRQFGSSVVLRAVPATTYGWLIEEVLPVNSDGQLRATDPLDGAILAVHRGEVPLPLWTERLDAISQAFLSHMQKRAGRFNLDEQLNALRLWQDYQLRAESLPGSRAEAAAVEYLITLFDYHTIETAETEDLANRYGVTTEAVMDAAREITSTLGVTQFDDRYSIHPDPIAHYRQLFGELGIEPRRDEAVKRAGERPVFDSIEVPPDDDTFFGPS